MKRLAELLGAEATLVAGDANTPISSIKSGSRSVQAGDLFAAMPGTRVDGAQFIPAAVDAGATAVLCQSDAVCPELPAGIALLRAENARLALARMAARFYGAQPACTVAVTGTSGKSSAAEFTRQIFKACGRSAASLGTIGIVRPDGDVYGGLTTPDPITLHRELAELAGEGVTHLAFEASSHGLDQYRSDGVVVQAAGFTNLGRDHLDYHSTVEDYFQAKLRLFSERIADGGTAVINIDGDYGARVVAAARARGLGVITVGRSEAADLRIVATEQDGFGQRVRLAFAGDETSTRLALIGGYQADNAALAAGLAIAVGEDPGTCFAAFETLAGVSGRLEPVGEVRGASVIVDYAHKPEALEAALTALRPFATGNLFCVVGCGGDRDKGKRPIMGEIAQRLADIVIITDDNPRTEDPAQIRAEMIAAAPDAREIGDRGEAIAAAISEARAGDVVLIAGKGHETGQIVGDTVQPFSDQDVARAAILVAPAR